MLSNGSTCGRYAADQDWHCDGRHLAGAPQAGFDGAGAAPPYAVCVFCPLVGPFTKYESPPVDKKMHVLEGIFNVVFTSIASQDEPLLFCFLILLLFFLLFF